jgi:NAD(P)-dependent dehydrogenase (short-subunit alcohol dehydrogenase family)
MSDTKSTRAVVVGASLGFGRGIAEALVRAGAEVHALSRGDASELVRATGGRVHAIAADAMDPDVALRLLREIKPNVVVLNAGATPKPAPIQEHTWESFSVNWDTDVKMTFHWMKGILNEPLGTPRPSASALDDVSGR